MNCGIKYGRCHLLVLLSTYTMTSLNLLVKNRGVPILSAMSVTPYRLSGGQRLVKIL